jgi:cytochrome b involved in lipid metabolism
MNKSKLLTTSVIILVTGVVVTSCTSEPLTSSVPTPEPSVENQESIQSPQPEIPESKTQTDEKPEAEGQSSDQPEEVTPPVESDPPAQEDSEQTAETSSVSIADVQANDSRDSCWLILEGDVYDFTPVVEQHPFGNQLSQAICGQDATEIILENADADEVRVQIEPLYLGELDVE